MTTKEAKMVTKQDKINEKISHHLEKIRKLENELKESFGPLCRRCDKPIEYAIQYGCPVGYSLPEFGDCPYEKLDKNLNRVWVYSHENPVKPESEKSQNL